MKKQKKTNKESEKMGYTSKLLKETLGMQCMNRQKVDLVGCEVNTSYVADPNNQMNIQWLNISLGKL